MAQVNAHAQDSHLSAHAMLHKQMLQSPTSACATHATRAHVMSEALYQHAALDVSQLQVWHYST
jgi:hypothetical protein